MKKVKLGEVTINIDNRRKPLNNLQRIEKSLTKKYPYCGANNIIDYIDEYIFDENEEILCIAEDGGSWGKDEECTYVMNEKCWVNNHAHVLKMKSGVDINYIKLNLDYIDLSSYITGSTRGKLTKSSLEKIEIKLPDYHTQISISKKISDIQNLITKKKVQIQKYNELVKSRFNEMFGDIFDNPQSKLEDHIELNPNKKELQNFIGNVSFLPMSNVSENGKIDLSINRNIDDVRKGFTFFKDNDVIVAKITPCFENGKGAPVFGLLNGVGFGSTEFHVLRPKNTVNTVWLYHVTMLSKFRLEGERKMTGSGGQRRITKDFINNFKLNIPPLSLQNEFADFVAQVDKSQFACQMAIKLWRISLKSSII